MFSFRRSLLLIVVLSILDGISAAAAVATDPELELHQDVASDTADESGIVSKNTEDGELNARQRRLNRHYYYNRGGGYDADYHYFNRRGGGYYDADYHYYNRVGGGGGYDGDYYLRRPHGGSRHRRGHGGPPLVYYGYDWCNEWYPCGMCEGECDSDRDCEGHLVCFKRNSYSPTMYAPVPGCSGDGIPSQDYCTDPDLVYGRRSGGHMGRHQPRRWPSMWW